MRPDGLIQWVGWIVFGLSVSLAWASPSLGGAFVLYDDFAGSRIRPDQWYGSETRRPGAILEASRFVADGKLHLSVVGYGRMGSNDGSRTGHFGLGVKTSRSITALQAELTVTNATVQTCTENTRSTQGRAQLVGFFFNDGGSRGKGDLTGDVVALLEKVADSQDGHFIRALVLRCQSWSCSKGESIKAILFKRKWTLGEPDVLRMEWEPERSQFVFTVNPGAAAGETRRIAYDKALGPHQAPERQRQRVRVRSQGANCKAGRRGVVMTASVDDVYLQFLDPQAVATLSSQALTPGTRTDGGVPLPSSREITDDIYEQ